MVTIITDGRENSSKNFRADTIRDLIKQKESENWIITYMGAHGNIEEEASILALSQKKTMCFDKGSRGFDELLEKELIARKKAAQPRKIPAALSKDPAPAPRKNKVAKNQSPPKVGINRAKLAKKPQKRTARMRFNHLDLLVKVKRDNVCFFYVIGEKTATFCSILPHAIRSTKFTPVTNVTTRTF